MLMTVLRTIEYFRVNTVCVCVCEAWCHLTRHPNLCKVMYIIITLRTLARRGNMNSFPPAVHGCYAVIAFTTHGGSWTYLCDGNMWVEEATRRCPRIQWTRQLKWTGGERNSYSQTRHWCIQRVHDTHSDAAGPLWVHHHPSLHNFHYRLSETVCPLVNSMLTHVRIDAVCIIGCYTQIMHLRFTNYYQRLHSIFRRQSSTKHLCLLCNQSRACFWRLFAAKFLS